jgi:methanogenic corrinoid protein MtbC1
LNPFTEHNSTFDFEKGKLVFQPLSELMSKAEKSFKERNIEPTKATISDWEVVLKEIGKIFRKGDTFLSCTVSDKNFVHLSFVNDYLFSFCETKDDGKSEKKD